MLDYSLPLLFRYFAVGCPADWLNVDSTCFVFRGGSRTLKEARDYCQVCNSLSHWFFREFLSNVTFLWCWCPIWCCRVSSFLQSVRKSQNDAFAVVQKYWNKNFLSKTVRNSKPWYRATLCLHVDAKDQTQLCWSFLPQAHTRIISRRLIFWLLYFTCIWSTMEDMWHRLLYQMIWNLSIWQYRHQDQMENHLCLYGWQRKISWYVFTWKPES